MTLFLFSYDVGVLASFFCAPSVARLLAGERSPDDLFRNWMSLLFALTSVSCLHLLHGVLPRLLDCVSARRKALFPDGRGQAHAPTPPFQRIPE